MLKNSPSPDESPRSHQNLPMQFLRILVVAGVLGLAGKAFAQTAPQAAAQAPAHDPLSTPAKPNSHAPAKPHTHKPKTQPKKAPKSKAPVNIDDDEVAYA